MTGPWKNRLLEPLRERPHTLGCGAILAVGWHDLNRLMDDYPQQMPPGLSFMAV